MRGDALASGDKKATFSVAPGLRFDEGVMRDDRTKLTKDDFMSKYLITNREYELMNSGTWDDEKVSAFAEEMKTRLEGINRAFEGDAVQEQKLRQDCPLTPFVALGITGRVIVSRDTPAKQAISKLALPKSMRKEKELLPTTGHIIKAVLFEETANGMVDISDRWNGVRVMFSPMSGTAICMKNYPTWIQLEVTEILAIMHKEDVEMLDEPLEPM